MQTHLASNHHTGKGLHRQSMLENLQDIAGPRTVEQLH